MAERLLARNGWRNTSLAQIAKEAGVTPAGLLHHFESKEQLLNAVLDARDADDDTHADYRSGDLITELSRVPERFDRAPELDRHLHGAARREHRARRPAARPPAQAVSRRRSTSSPRSSSAVSATDSYRPDFDAASKAVEILAFINGMETLWLLDPSIPLTEVFKGYAESLGRELAPRSST